MTKGRTAKPIHMWHPKSHTYQSQFFFWGGGGGCIAVFRFISDIGPALGMDIEVPRYYRDWPGNIGLPIKSQYRTVLALLAGPTQQNTAVLNLGPISDTDILWISFLQSACYIKRILFSNIGPTKALYPEDVVFIHWSNKGHTYNRHKMPAG